MHPRGRTPKWCSDRCRRRAWEQRRAAESGLAAVDVVVQKVAVEAPLPRSGTEAAELVEHVAQQAAAGAYSTAELRRIRRATAALMAANTALPDGPAELVTATDHVDAVLTAAARLRSGDIAPEYGNALGTAASTLLHAVDEQRQAEVRRQRERARRQERATNEAYWAERMKDPVFVECLRQAQEDIRSATFLSSLDVSLIEDDDDHFLDAHPESLWR